MNQRIPLLDIHLTKTYKTVKTTPQWLLRHRQKEQYDHRVQIHPTSTAYLLRLKQS